MSPKITIKENYILVEPKEGIDFREDCGKRVDKADNSATSAPSLLKEVKVEIKAGGSYFNLLSFLLTIEDAPRLMTINKLNMVWVENKEITGSTSMSSSPTTRLALPPAASDDVSDVDTFPLTPQAVQLEIEIAAFYY